MLAGDWGAGGHLPAAPPICNSPYGKCSPSGRVAGHVIFHVEVCLDGGGVGVWLMMLCIRFPVLAMYAKNRRTTSL